MFTLWSLGVLSYRRFSVALRIFDYRYENSKKIWYHQENLIMIVDAWRTYTVVINTSSTPERHYTIIKIFSIKQNSIAIIKVLYVFPV
jgi:hypothetical protein